MTHAPRRGRDRPCVSNVQTLPMGTVAVSGTSTLAPGPERLSTARTGCSGSCGLTTEHTWVSQKLGQPGTRPEQICKEVSLSPPSAGITGFGMVLQRLLHPSVHPRVPPGHLSVTFSLQGWHRAP